MRIALLVVFVLACGGPPREEQRSRSLHDARVVLAPPPAPEGEHGPWDAELTLENAAFRIEGAPSVLVHAPPSFDPSLPLRLVVFLHGWNGCARALMRTGPTPCRDGAQPRLGAGLADVFDEAHSDALFVLPQLAFDSHNGSAGRFVEDGRFSAFVNEMLAALGAKLGPRQIESITLAAHSAGFETTLAVIAHGRVDVSRVILFDALYVGVPPFVRWAAQNETRRLVSLYTADARTSLQNRMLAFRARNEIGGDAVAQDLDRPLAEQVGAYRVVVARARAPHGLIPARHMPELLAPLGLGARR
jgi:pimeloyl-ACP methyl ester carboxylesterase